MSSNDETSGGIRWSGTPVGMLDRAFARSVFWALVALMAVMCTVVFAQVVLRYVFNSSIDWADEVSRLAFVWTVFLAIPLAIRDASNRRSALRGRRSSFIRV